LQKFLRDNFSKKNNFFAGFVFGLMIFLIINFISNSVLVSDLVFNFIPERINLSLSPNLKVNKIMSLLNKCYINKYSEQNVEDSMYYGLLNSLGDPYTSYMDKKTFSSFLEMTKGAYVGIGTLITIDKSDNSLVIISSYENSPASKAGILPGDKILAVDNQTASINNYEKIISKLKGSEGTSVRIKIYRPSENQTRDVDVIREEINSPTVMRKVFNNDIGYIRITNFDENTYDQFMNAYNKIAHINLKGLVIDLRNNPGGLLGSVIRIADELIPKSCIVYTEDKFGNKKYFYSDENFIKTPLAILVNENSASASEVLSGAVKDLKRGVLIGTKTFGKGLVQSLFPLRDGSAVKITIAKYYTPSGVCINGKGIEPDYEVKLDPELSMRASNLTLKEDLQLQKAIEVF
jgi:carboxyl-terminal processing protease